MMVIATQVELFGIAFARKISLLGTWANNFSVGFEALPISQSRMLNGCHYGKWVNVRSKKCWCDIYLIVLSWSFSKFVSSMKYTALTNELQKNWCRLLKVHLKTQDNFVFVLFLCFLVASTKYSIILLCVARMICTIIQLKSNSLIVRPKASISMTPSEPINDGIIFSYFLILYTMVAIADRSTLIPPSCVECRHICLFSVFSSHCISWLFLFLYPILFYVPHLFLCTPSFFMYHTLFFVPLPYLYLVIQCKGLHLPARANRHN